MSAWTHTTSSSPPETNALLLRVHRDGESFIVSDVGVGNLYGVGKSLPQALADYCTAIEELIHALDGRELSLGLRGELARYRRLIAPEGEE